MSCKLYLVPQDVIESWKSQQRTQQVDHPVESSLESIDRNMQSILKNTTMSNYDKEKLYSQSLGSYIGVRDRNKSDTTSSKVSEDIMDSIPKLYRSKAMSFIKFLQTDPDVQWDDQGQLVLKGKVINKSHIVDLLHDALRYRKKVKRPEGWEQLSEHLQEKNIPQELIGNATWTAKTPKHLKEKPGFSFTPGKPRQSKIRAQKKIKNWIHLEKHGF